VALGGDGGDELFAGYPTLVAFSSLNPPYSADKQVTRRARAAFGADANNLIHYLHYGAHQFHVGGKNPMNPARPRGILAAAVTSPVAPGDLMWQTDGGTVLRSQSLST
jgi:asparagine synthetase B (glutamine-hydrolysing)